MEDCLKEGYLEATILEPLKERKKARVQEQINSWMRWTGPTKTCTSVEASMTMADMRLLSISTGQFQWTKDFLPIRKPQRDDAVALLGSSARTEVQVSNKLAQIKIARKRVMAAARAEVKGQLIAKAQELGICDESSQKVVDFSGIKRAYRKDGSVEMQEKIYALTYELFGSPDEEVWATQMERKYMAAKSIIYVDQETNSSNGCIKKLFNMVKNDLRDQIRDVGANAHGFIIKRRRDPDGLEPAARKKKKRRKQHAPVGYQPSFHLHLAKQDGPLVRKTVMIDEEELIALQEKVKHHLEQSTPGSASNTAAMDIEAPGAIVHGGLSVEQHQAAPQAAAVHEEQSQAAKVHEALSQAAEVHEEAQSQAAKLHEAQSQAAKVHEAQSQAAEVHKEAQSQAAEVHEAQSQAAEVHEAQSQAAEVHEALTSQVAKVHAAQSQAAKVHAAQSQAAEVHAAQSQAVQARKSQLVQAKMSQAAKAQSLGTAVQETSADHPVDSTKKQHLPPTENDEGGSADFCPSGASHNLDQLKLESSPGYCKDGFFLDGLHCIGCTVMFVGKTPKDCREYKPSDKKPVYHCVSMMRGGKCSYVLCTPCYSKMEQAAEKAKNDNSASMRMSRRPRRPRKL